MRKPFLFIAVLFACLSLFSFGFQGAEPTVSNIVVQFTTTNGYGNNLYIDNFSIGNQFQYDVTVSSINNIPKDTNYSFSGVNAFKVAPSVTVTNIGKAIASSFNVVFTSGAYTSTKPVTSLASGASTEIIFDSLTITPNTGNNMKVYSTWGQDQNKSNDTLSQYSYYFPGTRRKVAFEAFTSSTCAPCASQNPSLDAFLAARYDTVVPIKYHVNWPSPGNDPMYLANSTQNSGRVSYYSISAVPTLMIDGVHQQVSSYTTLSNLLNPYTARLNKGTPVGITVTDQKIAGDSIQANVTVTVISPLTTGNYKLKVCSISRVITYPTAPGTNGETVFKDVFRFMYPDLNGVSIPTAPGTYNYTYKYKLTPLANTTDTIQYTSAFVQNETTKEIMNAAKGYVSSSLDNNIATVNATKETQTPCFITSTGKVINGSYSYDFSAGFNYEMFEAAFPPAGWSVVNPDGNLTWQWYNGANGPSFGGSRSVKFPFYDYSTTGQLDHFKSRVYNNVDATDSIKFDWAYAQYSASYIDRLTVKVSVDGGSTFPVTIFDKSAAELATAPIATSSFVPTASQWKTFAIAASIVSAKEIGTGIPESYDLKQNFPNPFNPVTNIVYNLPKQSNVTLKVYDINGRLVSTLFNGTQSAGIYVTQFDGSNMSSGIYFYKIEAGDYSMVKKMMLVK